MEAAQQGGPTGKARVSVYECFLQGVILPESYDLLIERLNSLSDTEVEEIHYREIVFKSHAPSNTQAPPSISTPQKNELRVRCNTAAEQPKNWSLHYLGVPLNRDKMTVNIRNIISVDVSDNIVSFLVLMGYQYQFEFLRDGVSFLYQKKKISTSVTKIKKVVDKDDLGQAAEVDPCWLVEVSALTTDEGIIETTDELNNFANYLAPLVEVKRIDFRKFVNPEMRAEAAKKDEKGDAQQQQGKKRAAPPSPQRLTPQPPTQPPPPMMMAPSLLVPPPPAGQPPAHMLAAAAASLGRGMPPSGQPMATGVPPPAGAGGPVLKKAKTEGGWINLT